MNRGVKSSLIVLFFLSPFLAELMTGSAPPLEFFHPVTFFFICLWYGCGVLLVREIAVRFHLSWKGIFLMGMCFGILEEGIFIKTFFDPLAIDLEIFGTFGRYFGTNIAWAVFLTPFHAINSILFPILLTYLFFPETRTICWLGKRGMIICAGVLFCLSLVGWIQSDPSRSGTPYIPSGLHLTGTLLVILGTGFLSLSMKEGDAYSLTPVKQPLAYGLKGFLTGTLFSFVLWIVADISRNTLVLLIYTGGILWLIFRTMHKSQGNLPTLGYVIVGYYMPWALIGIAQEWNGMTGMSISGSGFLLFFFMTLWHLHSRYHS